MQHGETIELSAAEDGHRFAAYACGVQAPDTPGVVILQEIFGVTGHIRALVERYAGYGFRVVAPALFERLERGVELGYDEVERGRALAGRLALPDAVKDIGAAMEAVQTGAGVAVVGYCYGGALAYLAACELPISAAVGYYGTRTLELLERRAACPLMLHFGALDASLPPPAVQRIHAANPEARVHVYPGAGHGFNCPERDAYHAESAAQAERRTLEFIRRYVG
jgi:carboxymethylenebutenolidase